MNLKPAVTTSIKSDITSDSLRLFPALKVVVLVMLFSVAALLEARNLYSLTDPSGVAAITDRRLDPGSSFSAALGTISRDYAFPWADSNWGSQVVLSVFYRLMGLRALPVIQMLLHVLLAIATFLLAGGRRGGFWLAVVISTWVQIVMFHSLAESVLLNAVLLSVELWVLFASRASTRRDLLLWVPVLMLLWANLDWHFAFGMLVLLLFLCAAVVEHLLDMSSQVRAGLDLGRVAIITIASCIASFLSPYSYRSYLVAWENWFGKAGLAVASEMKSMDFRSPEHYLLLLLAMLAFFAIGRQQARDHFKVLLLVVFLCMSFAFQREAWTVVVASVAIIGDVFFPINGARSESAHSTKFLSWVVGGIVLVILVAAVARIPSRSETLLEVTAKKLPVKACDFIKQDHLPAPLYNELSWGNFLTWYLPDHPVSIDDRYEMYGDEKLLLSSEEAIGSKVPAQDPDILSASTIILSPDNGLVHIPRMFPNSDLVFQAAFPGFHEVYRDDLAVVLSKPQ